MAIGEAEELNRRLIEAMPGGVVHVRADGSIASANAEALSILGMSFDAVTQRYTQDWAGETLYEDGTPCPVTDYPVTRALMTGLPQPRMTIGIRQPGGEVCWAVFTAVPVHDDHAVTGAVVTFLDVTAQRRAAAALADSEAKLRSVLESAPNFIVSADREGRITYTNRLSAGMPSMVGSYAWDAVGPADRERVRDAVDTIVRTGTVVDYETAGADGKRYLVGAGPVRVDGEVVGVTFNAWDITRSRELEAQIAVSDRLATIGTLAAGVAHEINNPLTYLLANLTWLERETLTPRGQSALASTIEGANRIRDVVRDLGSLSRVDAGREGPLDLHQVLDTALRMADHEIRVRARVRRDYGDTPRVVANDSRLGQLLLNLIVNAAQAIVEGDVDHNEIAVTTRAHGGRVVIEIRDTGAGIPPELMDRIFEPFVTTKPKGMGTGLGLHIAQSIVRSLGGEIAIESVVGEGTTVRVDLPAAPRIAEATAEDDTPVAAPATGRLRCLVIDDEPHLTTIIAELLADHEVTAVNSGRAALPLLAEHHYDVVLCDLVMPELTGMELHDEIAATDADTASKIVFMTGGAFTERARDFLATHDNPVLAKPFSVSELRDLVSRATTR